MMEIVPNSEGIRRAALSSPEVRAAIARETARVEANAKRLNGGKEVNQGTRISSSQGGNKRARGVVRMTGARALARESEVRPLGRSIGR